MIVMRLCVVVLLMGVCSQANAVVTLSADTSRPEMSTFALGESVDLTFNVTGMTPGQQDVLNLDFVDELGQTIESQQVNVTADGSGNWAAMITRPNDGLGFYRVQSQLNNSGSTLPALGSRSAGYLTYAVVPDPADRVLYGEKDTFFGMQGAWNQSVNVLPYLGVRWVLSGSGYSWGAAEPNYSGEFAFNRAIATGPFPATNWNTGTGWPSYTDGNGQQQSWEVYTVPYLYFQPPDWAIVPGSEAAVSAILKPEAEQAWKNYLTQVAAAYTENNPNREENIYQITWEPVPSWGWSGTAEQLIRIHELAYEALHAADPKAVVIGPTLTSATAQSNQNWNAELFQKGLGDYVDGYAAHPYFNSDPREPPETAGLGLAQGLQQFRQTVLDESGKDLPRYGLEQGYYTANGAGGQADEIDQARYLVRANLITMGEGYEFNMAFYNADFPSGEGQWGFYYNLNSAIPFGTDKTGPKPIVPAYAAMTFLLEGRESAGPIAGLSGTALGYIYENAEDTVLALWDYSGSPNVVIDVGVDEVELFDWMGNSQMVSAPGGMLPLTLGSSPIYVRYAVGLAGDFDDNGIVNGNDFLLWQRDMSVGNLADWEANFGTGGGALAASAATVPEPATAVLLSFAMAAAAMARRRRSFEFSPA